MENKNTRGIGKIMVGITIMFFSLFFSLLINTNKVEAAYTPNRELYVDCESGIPTSTGSCANGVKRASIDFIYKSKESTSWTSVMELPDGTAISGTETFYLTKYDTIDFFRKKSEYGEFIGTIKFNVIEMCKWDTVEFGCDVVRDFSGTKDDNDSISFTDTDLGDGHYFLYHYIKNRADLINTYELRHAYKIIVDTLDPTVSFSSNSNSTYKRSHSVTVTVDDNNKLDHDYLMYAWSTSSTFPSTLTPSSLTKSSDTKGTKTLTTPTGASGKYYLHVEIKDFAGNTTRASTSGRFYLDNTAPTVTVSASSNWTNSNVNASGTCSDPGGSGIAQCELLSNGSVVSTSATTSVSGTITTQGVNSVQVRATDKAGNVGISSVTQVRINRTKPVITVSPDSLGSSSQRSSRVEVTITANDYGGGINYIRYRWCVAGTTDSCSSYPYSYSYEYSKNEITVNSPEQTMDRKLMLEVYVIDTVGNTGVSRTFGPYYITNSTGPQIPTNIKIDYLNSSSYRLSMIISPNAGRELHYINESNYPYPSSAATYVSITGPSFYKNFNKLDNCMAMNDIHGGSSGCMFNNREMYLDTDGLVLPSEGKYSVYISVAEYYIGNPSGEKFYSKYSFSFIYDVSNPNTPSAPTLSTTSWTSGAINASYSCSGDNSGGSGLKSCNLYNGSTLVHSGNVTGTNNVILDKYYSNLTVRATDMAGNYSSSSSRVAKIDKKAPTANLTVSKYTWTNKDVTINSSCSDSQSGIFSCNVFINGNPTTTTSISAEGVYDVQTIAIDNVGNVGVSTVRTVRIDKTIKSVEFDRSTINKLAFSVNGLVSTKSPLKTMEVYVNGVPLSNVTEPTNQNNITYATFNFYGIYNVSVITEDTAGNIGTFAHVIRYENPGFSLDEITVRYGSGSATHTTGLQRDDSDVYFASVRNDGSNPSKIVSTSTELLYDQFFGDGAFSTSVKYKINNDETLRSLTNNNEIEIPAIGSGSCSVADYVTCARIDTITLVVEASGIQVIQRILIISLDVRPVDVSAGSGTQSVNVNVGQEYNVEPLSFTSQIGNEIVSIEETIEFNGEVVDSIDTNKIGTYTITTIATDSEGFKSLPVVRTIVIKDSIPPTISLIGEQTITIKKGQTYVDEGSLAIDNVDGEITVYGSGEVNYNKAGTYEITYQYIDSNGNVSEVVTRTIIVKPDYAKYVILALSSITVLGIAFLLIKKFNVKTSY